VKEKTNIEFKNSLGPWFGRTMKVIDEKIEEILSENHIDLSKMQFIILKNIEEKDGIYQNELALFSKRNKSTLTRMINTLIKKGYISRYPSKKDKRKNHIYLTPSGKKIIHKATPHFHLIALLVEKNLTKEEIEMTKNIFKKIQTNITGSVVGPMI
jgi:DNA-binding MarR family transcriptional regulator